MAACSCNKYLVLLAGWTAVGFVAQTLVAWAIGFSPRGWPVGIPPSLLGDDNRVSAMFAEGQYSVIVSHGLASLRDEYRIRYQDLGSAEAATAYTERWQTASDEVAAASGTFAGERTVREAPPGMLVYETVDAVAGVAVDSVLPGGFREIGKRDQLGVMATGWPYRSCRMTWVEREDGTIGPFRGVLVDPGVFPASWRAGLSMYYPAEETLGAIPAYPMLWGTVGNSVCFGASGLAVVGLFAMLRRRRRASRGLCMSCGYNLSGSSAATSGTCPECGSAFAQRSSKVSDPS